MLEIGEVVGDRYKLVEKIGRNTSRQTWLAQDLARENQNQVIVKFLFFGGEIQWSDLKLFEREAQILQQLNSPNIPQYKDYFSLDDQYLCFALVQEYIPGSSLKELLDKGKRFTELEIEHIAREILKILIYLHGFNPPILHRDIKPSNIILDAENSIYLVDFGAVQDSDVIEGSSFTVVGTYGYAPMEQFGGRTVPASDLYALGVTLIHLLTRTLPADLPSKNLTIQFRQKVNLSKRLAHWLDKMTAPALEKRFASAALALKYLEDDLYSLGQPSRVEQSPCLKPFYTEVKLYRSADYIEIVIPMKGEYLLPDKSSDYLLQFLILFILCGSIPWLFLFKVLPFVAVAICLFGFIFTPLTIGISYKILKQLFSQSKIFINQQQFEIKQTFMWSKVWQKGITNQIKDVSVSYAPKSQNGMTLNNSSIVINTQISQFSDQFNHYLFGQGLTEVELIWLANEIRDWLSQIK